MDNLYDITLISSGESPISATKNLKDILNIDIQTAHRYFTTLPCVIKYSVSKNEAEQIINDLAQAGIGAEMSMLQGVFNESLQAKEQLPSSNTNDTASNYNAKLIENYANLVERNIEARIIQKATEYCDKILEIDSNNVCGWKLKCKIEIQRFYDLLSSIDYSNSIYYDTNTFRYQEMKNKEKELVGINRQFNQYLKNTFLCANDIEKNKLTDYILELTTIYLRILKHMSDGYFARVRKMIDLPQDSIINFVKSHYTEKQYAVFMDKYSQIIIENVTIINKNQNHEYSGASKMLLDSVNKYIGDNTYITKKTEIDSKLESTKILQLKAILKDMNAQLDNIKTDFEEDSWMLNEELENFNDCKENLKKMYESKIDIPENLKLDIEHVLNIDPKSLFEKNTSKENETNHTSEIHVDNTPKAEKSSVQKQQNTKQGCYIATCVYGSYDCPEVWTLRRYRDYTLSSTWYGRAFIKIYYTISPTFVKRFGNTRLFKKICRNKLDNIVYKLNSKGYKSTKYIDKI